MTKQERQEMMAKARAAKALKTGQDTVQVDGQDEPMIDETDIEYDFSPYEVVKEQQEYGCRFILLLNGIHKAEFMVKKQSATRMQKRLSSVVTNQKW